jgi:K+ transporter
MDNAINTAVSGNGFLTAAVDKLTSGEALAFLIFFTSVAAIVLVFWYRHKEVKAKKEDCNATNLRKQLRDKEQAEQNKEIGYLKADLKETKQRLDNYATKAELAEVKICIDKIDKQVTEINKENFTKTDSREIFLKIDTMRESLDRYKDTTVQMFQESMKEILTLILKGKK